MLWKMTNLFYALITMFSLIHGDWVNFRNVSSALYKWILQQPAMCV